MFDYVPRSSSPEDGSYSSTKTEVMVGCGCKTAKDVISFSKERKIEFFNLSWADEMGLWHNEVIPIREMSEAKLADGIITASGLVLKPDVLTAKISPFAQPNTVHIVCTDASYDKEVRASLKAKHLNPGWIQMISKQVLKNSSKGTELDVLMNACEVPRTSPPRHNSIEWRIVKGNDSPPFDSSASPDSPGATVPSSPPSGSTSPRSPVISLSTIDRAQKKERAVTEGIPGLPTGYVAPPLLRPRQVHPTKASRLGLQEKPSKKRKNTDNLFCRHCGTRDTPEWRRGPDGRKSLCNACGLHYSKLVKRENLVVPQTQRTGALDLLLNPS